VSEEENLVKEIRDIRDECEVLANRLEAIAVKIEREHMKKEAKKEKQMIIYARDFLKEKELLDEFEKFVAEMEKEREEDETV